MSSVNTVLAIIWFEIAYEENILDRDLTAAAPNQKWVTDNTSQVKKLT